MTSIEDQIKDVKNASISEIFNRVSSSESGLSSSEASSRLEKFGYNRMPEKKRHPLLAFLLYFWGPIPWMIELAAILSAYIGHWEDFAIIMVLLLTNAVVGFWQEGKAQNAIESLRKKLAQRARTLRDGAWKLIPAEELVPGDIVRIRLGDIVPADVKIVSGDYLLVDQSALTGESLPVEKSASDVAFMSSVVKRGEVECVVVSTGLKTFFGKTAELVAKATNISHLQDSVKRIGYYLVALALILSSLIGIVSLSRGLDLAETLQFILVLVVAAIPAALPAVLSVTLSVGAIDLSNRQAIVSKLVSIEEMAGMDILCADKTGTITKNQLKVTAVKPFKSYSEADVLTLGNYATKSEDMDPIDLAIIEASQGLKEKPSMVYSVSDFKPFDPSTKRTEATLRDAVGNVFHVSKGAPQVIQTLIGGKSPNVEATVDDFGLKGYRALGVARTVEGRVWDYVGIIGLYDPPREDSAETIKEARDMGVSIKLLTGDHLAVTKEIADMVGLDSNISLVSSFIERPIDEAEKIIEQSTGFAEVFPEHKYRIVELLQGKDHIVGMTGDGVNDAPALEKANVGIAVDGATDVARSAADIVLTQPGLSVIVDAMRESRRIFRRINNYIIYRLAETIRVLFFITGSIIVAGFYPVTAVMIVLLAILNDLPIMTMAYDNVVESPKPEKWKLKEALSVATMLGILGVASSLLLFYIGLTYLGLSQEMLQSFVYLKLSVAGHLTIFVARTRGSFWSIRPSKLLLLAVVSTQTIATLITVYGILLPPIGWGLAAFVWVFALASFLVNDFSKRLFYRLTAR